MQCTSARGERRNECNPFTIHMTANFFFVPISLAVISHGVCGVREMRCSRPAFLCMRNAPPIWWPINNNCVCDTVCDQRAPQSHRLTGIRAPRCCHRDLLYLHCLVSYYYCECKQSHIKCDDAKSRYCSKCRGRYNQRRKLSTGRKVEITIGAKTFHLGEVRGASPSSSPWPDEYRRTHKSLRFIFIFQSGVCAGARAPHNQKLKVMPRRRQCAMLPPTIHIAQVHPASRI